MLAGKKLQPDFITFEWQPLRQTASLLTNADVENTDLATLRKSGFNATLKCGE
jgi:hypothetical protein